MDYSRVVFDLQTSGLIIKCHEEDLKEVCAFLLIPFTPAEGGNYSISWKYLNISVARRRLGVERDRKIIKTTGSAYR